MSFQKTSTDQNRRCQQEECVRKFLADRDNLAARKAVLESFIPLALLLAKIIYKDPEIAGKFSVGDIESIAIIEINGALDRFDPKYSATFKTYVISRLGGMHGKKGMLTKRVYKEAGIFTAKRAIEYASMCRADQTEKKLQQQIAKANAFIYPYSLDELLHPYDNECSPFQDFPVAVSIEDLYETQILLDQLMTAVGNLPERERYVITELFFHTVSARQVAEAMGYSITTIHNIKRKAITKLRSIMIYNGTALAEKDEQAMQDVQGSHII